jgi:hypothetical protein
MLIAICSRSVGSSGVIFGGIAASALTVPDSLADVILLLFSVFAFTSIDYNVIKTKINRCFTYEEQLLLYDIHLHLRSG